MLRLLGLAAFLCLLAAAARAGGPVDPPPPKVAAAAWDAAESGPAEILIRLKERADLSAASSLPAREDRARFVHLALRATAERSQADLRKWLAAERVEHRPFVIVNLVWARADRGVILALAARPEVESIVFNPWVKGIADAVVPGLPDAPSTLRAVEWNVSIVGAPTLWSEGFRGEGLVVGDQDTGVRWTHDLIKSAYRGWDAGAGTARIATAIPRAWRATGAPTRATTTATASRTARISSVSPILRATARTLTAMAGPTPPIACPWTGASSTPRPR